MDRLKKAGEELYDKGTATAERVGPKLRDASKALARAGKQAYGDLKAIWREDTASPQTVQKTFGPGAKKEVKEQQWQDFEKGQLAALLEQARGAIDAKIALLTKQYMAGDEQQRTTLKEAALATQRLWHDELNGMKTCPRFENVSRLPDEERVELRKKVEQAGAAAQDLLVTTTQEVANVEKAVSTKLRELGIQSIAEVDAHIKARSHDMRWCQVIYQPSALALYTHAQERLDGIFK
jgi:hypothetical protein